MSQPIVDRILLTNDDGIDAPGLETLARVASTLAREVWIVAPAFDQSGVATSISLHHPLRLAHFGERRYSVTGTPADCVTMAVRHLMRDAPPDLVLSGINRGANLGRETLYSGTVGAALTALLLGVPTIALSQAFTDRSAVRWATAERLAPDTIRRLHAIGWPREVALNVNFPDVAAGQAGPITASRQGRGTLETIDVVERTDLRDQRYHWFDIKRRELDDDPQSEAYLLRHGRITVTPLQFERTDEQARTELAARLG
ncbi:5'/3'-nucleotidase SurE [Halotalea alkalilenta]|uniref:5'/3'-nucleotidase SurE n=1 Tax=Halotalea alkalilenta TaxID=376489 RepID=UPI000485AF5B|nr:5'/3'-nucleotidase SurE [Halotalea alkalilenta]